MFNFNKTWSEHFFLTYNKVYFFVYRFLVCPAKEMLQQNQSPPEGLLVPGIHWATKPQRELLASIGPANTAKSWCFIACRTGGETRFAVSRTKQKDASYPVLCVSFPFFATGLKALKCSLNCRIETKPLRNYRKVQEHFQDANNKSLLTIN